ncbi:MAG: aminotransferase class I/II-fold pyridoxal phosphate-dependent enzyme [Deltaproteobacteria bacterium]|nr:aminotransferase class I/II-fold pyridoxal phosphate-dependent enzyme [Myxococcales bacterium]MCZ6571265.1 aminotransferase class I/II-fold pyridoxal phosphate-dependent enzyme [Deltaproteobacteria bacterium]
MMHPGRPRIALIGGTYRALCVLEFLLERGDRVVAFIGQESEGERDFCPEILELCDCSSIPARSARKLGEEVVRWLEDRIRPDLVIAIGVNTEIPLAIGGNCRLGLLEVIDCFSSDSCPGVVLRQRGHDVDRRELERPQDAEEDGDTYLQMVDEMLDAVGRYLDQLTPARVTPEIQVSFSGSRFSADELDDIVARPSPGPETGALERELREYVGAESTFVLSSHREALALLVQALELGEGDEVICPGIVSASVIEAIRASGARPVFVDVEPNRLTLDPVKLHTALSPRARCMVIAHSFGQPAALDQLYAVAESAGLEVIEDAGTSLGARFGESRLGRSPCACVFRMRLGQAASASGAALVAVPDALAERLRERAQEHRLGDGAAAALRRLLQTWDDRISTRRENARAYSAALVRYDAFEIPPTPEDALPVYSGYVLRLTRFARTSSDDLHKLLGEAGIEIRRISVPITDRELVRLPVAESAASNGLLLPVENVTDAEREHVLDGIFSYAIG